jgi:N-acetyl-anhydromuramyl-L-alanine amidase AmpD
MTYSLTWLPNVLKDAGLVVAEVEGWQTRGIGNVGPTFGVLCHHTAGRKDGNMPALKTLINGRSDLQGPLSQLGLGRDGTFYVIAAGLAHHAGRGTWMGANQGNLNFIGIEAENTGRDDDWPWPPEQIRAYHHGVAAILKHVGLGPERCAGHKEWALPRGRKPDPNLDMNQFRAEVAAIMRGTASPLPQIPKEEPVRPGGATRRPTLRRGSENASVKALQRALGLDPSGLFAAATEAKVREFQRKSRLVPDGIVGPKTWAAIDALAPAPLSAQPAAPPP